MIKELGVNDEPNWDEKLQLELSLAELQIIYDCVGAVPIRYLNLKHKENLFTNKYNDSMFHGIYSDLDDILSKHNGLTDDDIDVDTFVELDIVKGDE